MSDSLVRPAPRAASRAGARSEAAELARQLQEMRAFARVMDGAVRVPGTRIEVGLDAILGLLPGVGDLLTGALSLSIVYRAWRLGASAAALVQMLCNLALDVVIGSVPVAGDVFDLVWKANQRNVDLLARDLTAQQQHHAAAADPRP